MSYQHEEHSIVERLNRVFYSVSPADYFLQRLTLIVLLKHRPELFAVEIEGVNVGGLPISLQSSPDGEEVQQQRYIATESQVLLHHVAETVLRLYFAHKPRADGLIPPCPWQQIAQITSSYKFKDMVEKGLIDTQDVLQRRAWLAEVFLGTTSPEAIDTKVDEQDWQRAVINLDILIGTFAHIFLEQAYLYNAAKHGLAVNASVGVVKLTSQSGSYEHEGDVVAYLSYDRDEEGQREWRLSQVWVNTEQATLLALLGCDLINSLWDVASARYFGEQTPEVALPLLLQLNSEDHIEKGTINLKVDYPFIYED